jgi:hypothetical protein
MYTNSMTKSDEEILKKVKAYDKSLPEDKRNPNVEKDLKHLIELSAKPLPIDKEKQRKTSRYNGKQTHLHKSGDT